MGIAVGGLDLHHTLAHFQDGDIKCPSPQVEDQDGLQSLLVQPIGQRCGGGLIDDTQYIQPGDLACVFGGLTLRVVEVSRDSNHCLGDWLSQIGLGVILQLLQNHSRYLLGRVLSIHRRDVDSRVVGGTPVHLEGNHLSLDLCILVVAANEAFDGGDCVLRVDDSLAFGRLAYQPLAFLSEGHH